MNTTPNPIDVEAEKMLDEIHELRTAINKLYIKYFARKGLMAAVIASMLNGFSHALAGIGGGAFRQIAIDNKD